MGLVLLIILILLLVGGIPTGGFGVGNGLNGFFGLLLIIIIILLVSGRF